MRAGEELAAALIDRGLPMVLTVSSRRMELLRKLQQRAEQRGGIVKVNVVSLDVSDRDQVEKACNRVWDELGAVDIFVYNAGVSQGPNDSPSALTARLSVEQAHKVFETNFFGYMHACVDFLAALSLFSFRGSL